MKISVITCTWNSEPYLAESIASVLMQDYPDVEYIFVDGGSTDGTLDRIATISGEVKILHNVRGGIARAMNEGLRLATGDVVAHLHSDDYFAHPQVLSHVGHALEQTGAAWLFGRCLSHIDGKCVPESYIIPLYSYSRQLKGNFIPHPATFVRRSLLERLQGFDESIKFAMDYDLWLRLGKIADPVQLDEHLAVFRRHPGSLTSANQMASLEDDFAVRMRYIAKTPWSIAYHWAHYLVRRRRLAKLLSLQEGAQ